jgi:hypothetical protein
VNEEKTGFNDLKINLKIKFPYGLNLALVFNPIEILSFF